MQYERRYMKAAGRRRKGARMFEISVHLTEPQLEKLKERAEYEDIAISALVRSDIENANRRSRT